MKKIPDHAKKVFEGVIFDVYQWEQEMYDGSTATFEKLRRPNTLLAIAIVENKIMIVHDSQPDREMQVRFPGGRQEKGETGEEGIVREILEETGYKASCAELFNSEQPTNKIDWGIHTYILRDCKKVQDPTLEAGEKIDLKLVDFDELIKIMLDDEFRDTHLQLYILKMNGDYTEFRKLLGV